MKEDRMEGSTYYIRVFLFHAPMVMVCFSRDRGVVRCRASQQRAANRRPRGQLFQGCQLWPSRSSRPNEKRGDGPLTHATGGAGDWVYNADGDDGGSSGAGAEPKPASGTAAQVALLYMRGESGLRRSSPSAS